MSDDTNTPEVDEIAEMDPARLHAQEPAEGAVEPGDPTPAQPSAEEPAEGDVDPGEVTPEPAP